MKAFLGNPQHALTLMKYRCLMFEFIYATTSPPELKIIHAHQELETKKSLTGLAA